MTKGDVGTEKSLGLLRKAASSRNRDVKVIAKASIKKIRKRMQLSKTVAADKQPSVDSPFSESSDGSSVTATHSDGSPHASEDSAENLATGEGDWSSVDVILPGEPGDGLFNPHPAPETLTNFDAKPVRLRGRLESFHESPV